MTSIHVARISALALAGALAFAAVAQGEHVPLYPDLLAGVGRALRQGDGVHPNAAGVKVVAAGLAPVVARALKTRRCSGSSPPSPFPRRSARA